MPEQALDDLQWRPQQLVGLGIEVLGTRSKRAVNLGQQKMGSRFAACCFLRVRLFRWLHRPHKPLGHGAGATIGLNQKRAPVAAMKSSSLGQVPI